MTRVKIPVAKPDKTGDKMCNVCRTTYDRQDFYTNGVYSYGLYYLNCPTCMSTLAVKCPSIDRIVLSEKHP